MVTRSLIHYVQQHDTGNIHKAVCLLAEKSKVSQRVRPPEGAADQSHGQAGLGWAERVQGQTAPRPEHRCRHRHTIKKNETKKTSSEPRTRPSKRVGWRPFPQRQQTIGKKKENVKIQNREKGGEKKTKQNHETKRTDQPGPAA